MCIYIYIVYSIFLLVWWTDRSLVKIMWSVIITVKLLVTRWVQVLVPILFTIRKIDYFVLTDLNLMPTGFNYLYLLLVHSRVYCFWCSRNYMIGYSNNEVISNEASVSPINIVYNLQGQLLVIWQIWIYRL